jgi:7-cyano-7-deazaguanine synthase in queuosine biosynthesis
MKKVLIPFSGGLDSTYLIWNHLKTTNDEIYLINALLKSNKKQSKYESEARDKLWEWFHNRYSDRIHWIKNTTEINFKGGELFQTMLSQPPIWMFSMMLHQKDIDEVLMGYVMNDDTISYLDDIKHLFDSIKPFTGSKAKLKFPLMKTPKSKIWDEMPDELKSLIYFCESYDDEEIHCGECTCCKRFIFDVGQKAFDNWYSSKSKTSPKETDISEESIIVEKFKEEKKEKIDLVEHAVNELERVKQALKGVNEIKPSIVEENKSNSDIVTHKFDFSGIYDDPTKIKTKLKSILNIIGGFIEDQDFPIKIEITENIMNHLYEIKNQTSTLSAVSYHFFVDGNSYSYKIVEGDFDFIKIYHDTVQDKSLGLNIHVYNLPDYQEDKNNEKVNQE